MNKKILIISRAFPPMNGGGVQRIVKFAVYLEQFGWDVTVCAPGGNNLSWIDTSRFKELDNIEIIRIQEKVKKTNIINRIKNKITFYDSFFNWAKDVTSFFMKNIDFNYNYVVTSGPPHSVHMIGLKLKKEFNVKWVADFRDHYTLGPAFKPLSFIHKNIERSFEKNILKHSDLVITNTNFNRNDILNFFKNVSIHKIKTIYNGFDLNDLKLSNNPTSYNPKMTNLLYLGGLRGDHIDGYFYEMVKLANDRDPELFNTICINLIGDLTRRGNLIEELDLAKLFIFHDALPFDAVGDYIKASDGCLTWQNPNDAYKGTIAGKVFDYFGMKKPIFSLGQPESELSELINLNGIGMHSNVNDLNQATDDFISFLKNLKSYEKCYSKLDEAIYNSFKRKSQVKYLNELLLDLESKD